MIIRKLACLNQDKYLSGKSLSISTGLELYNIPKTVSLPDFECFTQSFLLAWFFPLLLPIFISNPIKP